MAKVKDPAELNVEDKLKNLYQLQSLMTEIDQIKTLRGELPLEVKDLEDEIAGLETRIEKINEDIASAKKEINERQGVIEKNKMDIERFENQMKNVRNNREYENFSKQIEYLRLDNELNQNQDTGHELQVLFKGIETPANHETLLIVKGAQLVDKNQEKLSTQALILWIDGTLLAMISNLRKDIKSRLNLWDYVEYDH